MRAEPVLTGLSLLLAVRSLKRWDLPSEFSRTFPVALLGGPILRDPLQAGPFVTEARGDWSLGS